MDRDLFVQSVKTLCKLKGIPPTVASRESGVGTSFLYDIKRGQTPSVEKVQMLAHYLGCTTSDLLGEDKGDAFVPDPVALDREDAQLLRRYHALSPEARGKLLGYLDALSSV